MRILWLKSDLLLPLDKGGKLRTWHLLRHLARRHDVTYLAFADRHAAPADIDGMREVASRVLTIPRVEPQKGSWRFVADVSRHLLNPVPYAVAKYRSRLFSDALRDLLTSEAFDVLVCDFLCAAVNLPRRLPCPAIIFTHNVESEIWRRHASLRSGFVHRALYRSQYRRMCRYEARTLQRFDGVLAVSETDRETFARIYPGATRRPVEVIPTGVDTQYFAASSSEPDSRHLVFTGSMDWLPNEDAMQFFCREVLPLVRAEEPRATLSIVGRSPTPAVRALNGGAVHVTGTVDDIRSSVAAAAVYVVPLRIGGGTRLKIFEAMAMGRAVVSTTIGAEGLPVAQGREVILADRPRAFADAIVRLLRDVNHRRALEHAGRRLVVERHDWSVAAAKLECALESFTTRKGKSCDSRFLDSDTSAPFPQRRSPPTATTSSASTSTPTR